eukprot:PITA_01552
MDEEFSTLMENNTWDLVPLPKGRKLVRCQWIYRKKIAVDGNLTSAIDSAKSALHDRFYMTDLGLLHYFLGLEVSQSISGINMAQPKYASDLLVHFQMTECKPTTSPFLSGIRFEDVVRVCSICMQEPHKLHWKATKIILRYVKGTSSFGIFYAADCPLSLIGYTDSDWAGDGTDRKSTYSYVFSFGLGPFFWSIKNQSTIALSIVEAKYRGVVNAATQAIWLQGLLSEFGIQYPLPTTIFCDNEWSIQILIDLVQRQRTKHIEIHMHYIRELIRD